MASLIDIAIACHARVLPGREGIDIATAAGRFWIREPDETEHDFLERLRSEAAAAGFTTVGLHGALNVAPPRIPPGDDAEEEEKSV